jgi:hypothetical protein
VASYCECGDKTVLARGVSELVRYSANPLQGDKKDSLLLCILL